MSVLEYLNGCDISFLTSVNDGGVTKAEYEDVPGGAGALGFESSVGGGEDALCGRTEACCFVRIHSGPKCIAVAIVAAVDDSMFFTLKLC